LPSAHTILANALGGLAGVHAALANAILAHAVFPHLVLANALDDVDTLLNVSPNNEIILVAKGLLD
jgi:hypothetical protein